MNILDAIDIELEMLYQEWKTCENESTKEYLLKIIESKKQQYDKIEKQVISELESEV